MERHRRVVIGSGFESGARSECWSLLQTRLVCLAWLANHSLQAEAQLESARLQLESGDVACQRPATASNSQRQPDESKREPSESHKHRLCPLSDTQVTGHSSIPLSLWPAKGSPFQTQTCQRSSSCPAFSILSLRTLPPSIRPSRVRSALITSLSSSALTSPFSTALDLIRSLWN